MEKIKNVTNDKERAFYHSEYIDFDHIVIDGPADGESAFKECSNITVSNSTFNLRYPFWHNTNLVLSNSNMSDLCRAALWYDKKVSIFKVKSNGIKALRECSDIAMIDSVFNSEEIFWKTKNINIKNSEINGAYAFLMSSDIEIYDLNFKIL